MLYDDLIARYRERGVPTRWREITPDEMRPAFRLFFRALPSPSARFGGDDEEIMEAAADAEQLIHDPAAALRKSGIPLDDGAHISTMVVNHEETLNRFIMYASVVVSANPHIVGITIVKEKE